MANYRKFGAGPRGPRRGRGNLRAGSRGGGGGGPRMSGRHSGISANMRNMRGRHYKGPYQFHGTYAGINATVTVNKDGKSGTWTSTNGLQAWNGQTSGGQHQEIMGHQADTHGAPGDYHGDPRVICTELHRTGEMSTEDYLRDVEFSKAFSDTLLKGYLVWAVKFVEWMQKYPKFRIFCKFVAQHRANDVAWRMNKGKFDLIGRFFSIVGENGCRFLGNFVTNKKFDSLYESWKNSVTTI